MDELDTLGIVGTGRTKNALLLHDLWREEVLLGLPNTAKMLFHHRSGLVLEREYRASRSPSMAWEAAQHLLEGDSGDLALGLLEECAQHQLGNGLPGDAAKTYERAVLTSSNDVDRFRATLGRITALKHAANWTEIVHVSGTAIQLAARISISWYHVSDLELLHAEAEWWCETDPHASLRRAIRFAEDETRPASHRIKAALLASIISANLGRLTELSAILAIVAGLPQACVEDRTNALMTKMVYHTEAGDLSIAVAAAEALIASERERGSVRGLARALRYSSYALRCLGEFDRALQALREALDLAEEHGLIGDAASASDSIVNLYLEQENIPAAKRWVVRARHWSAQVHAKFARTSPSINDAMIALATRHVVDVESLVDTDIAKHRRDPVLRQKLLNLSVLTRLFAGLGDIDRLITAVELLGENLGLAQTIGRIDFIVESYALGLTKLGKTKVAVDFVRNYLGGSRRDHSTPCARLAALAST